MNLSLGGILTHSGQNSKNLILPRSLTNFISSKSFCQQFQVTLLLLLLHCSPASSLFGQIPAGGKIALVAEICTRCLDGLYSRARTSYYLGAL